MSDAFMTIHMEVAGGPIEQKLMVFGEHISDLSVPFGQIAEDLQGDFATNMVIEGGLFGGTRSYLGAAGGPWKPLATSTVRERERLGYGGAHPILWRTGDLGHSLAERGAPGNIFEVGPLGLRVGTSIFHAGFHQRGTARMPARPIVGVSWTRREGIRKRIAAYVRAQVAAAGLRSSGSGSGGGGEG